MNHAGERGKRFIEWPFLLQIMGEREPRFGAYTLASLAGVVGAKYLLGGALAIMSDGPVSAAVVLGGRALDLAALPAGGHLGLTVACGTLLCLVAGGLVDGAGWARGTTVLTFAAVVAVSIPAVLATNVIIAAETAGMLVGVGYALARHPLRPVETPSIDDDDSASRVGSTLR